MAVRGLRMMEGEGELGSWFLARNSGRNLRDNAWLGSRATSLGRPLREWTSLHLLPEAREVRKAVLGVKSWRDELMSGS